MEHESPVTFGNRLQQTDQNEETQAESEPVFYEFSDEDYIETVECGSVSLHESVSSRVSVSLQESVSSPENVSSQECVSSQESISSQENVSSRQSVSSQESVSSRESIDASTAITSSNRNNCMGPDKPNFWDIIRASTITKRTDINISVKSKINLNNFNLLKVIGKGAYGKVFLVKKITGIDSETVYAMKAIQKTKIIKNLKTTEHIRTERQVLEAIKSSPFLANMHYAFQTSAKLYLILDFAPGGDLFTYLHKKHRFKEPAVRIYVAEIVLAIENLHKLGIIYRDLKLENILIDAEGHLVLTDFGMCKEVENINDRSYSFCGTVEYMAPEMVSNSYPGHNAAADWWSVGVLTFELLSGISPFMLEGQENAPEEVSNRIRFDEIVIPPYLSCEAQDFIKKLLMKNPLRRLGSGETDAEELKSHLFFHDLDWEAVAQRKIAVPFKPLLSSSIDTKYFSKEFTRLPAVDIQGKPPEFHDSYFRGFSYMDMETLLQQSLSNEETSSQKDKYQSGEKYPTDTPFFKNYELDLTIPRLGHGSFSVCRKCIHRKTQKEFAVKIISGHKYTDREIELLMACQGCSYIVTLYEVYYDTAFTYIVTELVTGGELLAQLDVGHAIEELEVHRLMKQLSMALLHMHIQRVVHRDLKPENILLTSSRLSDADVKLVDFGFARRMPGECDQPPRMKSPCFSLPYAAPEIMTQVLCPTSPGYGPQCDLWSLGVIYYYMLSGRPPFQSYHRETVSEFMDRVRDGDFSMEGPIWDTISEESKRIVKGLLTVDPARRLPIDELVTAFGIDYTQYASNIKITKKKMVNLLYDKMQQPNENNNHKNIQLSNAGEHNNISSECVNVDSEMESENSTMLIKKKKCATQTNIKVKVNLDDDTCSSNTANIIPATRDEISTKEFDINKPSNVNETDNIPNSAMYNTSAQICKIAKSENRTILVKKKKRSSQKKVNTQDNLNDKKSSFKTAGHRAEILTTQEPDTNNPPIVSDADIINSAIHKTSAQLHSELLEGCPDVVNDMRLSNDSNDLSDKKILRTYTKMKQMHDSSYVKYDNQQYSESHVPKKQIEIKIKTEDKAKNILNKAKSKNAGRKEKEKQATQKKVKAQYNLSDNNSSSSTTKLISASRADIATTPEFYIDYPPNVSNTDKITSSAIHNASAQLDSKLIEGYPEIDKDTPASTKPDTDIVVSRKKTLRTYNKMKQMHNSTYVKHESQQKSGSSLPKKQIKTRFEAEDKADNILNKAKNENTSQKRKEKRATQKKVKAQYNLRDSMFSSGIINKKPAPSADTLIRPGFDNNNSPNFNNNTDSITSSAIENTSAQPDPKLIEGYPEIDKDAPASTKPDTEIVVSRKKTLRTYNKMKQMHNSTYVKYESQQKSGSSLPKNQRKTRFETEDKADNILNKAKNKNIGQKKKERTTQKKVKAQYNLGDNKFSSSIINITPASRADIPIRPEFNINKPPNVNNTDNITSSAIQNTSTQFESKLTEGYREIDKDTPVSTKPDTELAVSRRKTLRTYSKMKLMHNSGYVKHKSQQKSTSPVPKKRIRIENETEDKMKNTFNNKEKIETREICTRSKSKKTESEIR